MRNVFSRWLPCVTLAAWSAILLYFADAPGGAFGKFLAAQTHLFSGRVDSFLIPAFRPYVLIAGCVLFLMSLAFLLFPADAECCSAADCGHPLSRFAAGKWLTFLVLVAPVTAAAFMTPDTFGKSVIMNRTFVTDGSALPKQAGRAGMTAEPDLPLPTNNPASVASATPAAPAAVTELKDYFAYTPEGYVKAEVLDLLYAGQDPALRKSFTGKTVELIAQLMPDPATNNGAPRFKAVRMFMTCCAADARPVATLVETDKATDLPEMTWVRIIGEATFPVENGRVTAILKAKSVTKTEPPEESMLY